MKQLMLLAFVACFLQTSILAQTGAGAIIYSDVQGQQIKDWGYDIKQEGKAKSLTLSLARDLFIDDGMTCLRIPFYPKDAHPKVGVVIDSVYADIIEAIQRVKQVKPNVVLFGSLKLYGPETFPSYLLDNNGVIASTYALIMIDYLKFLASNGIELDILGIDNEMEYNGGNITPTKHKQIVDKIRLESAKGQFKMPTRIVGPDAYSPQTTWLKELNDNGWGDRIDIAGTHYYPQLRPLSKLIAFGTEAGNRSKWNTEVHYKNDNTQDIISEATDCLISVFDGFDNGFDGNVWWSYSRTGIKGEILSGLVQSTILSYPVKIDDSDGIATDPSKLNTRSFRQGRDLIIWVLNNTNANFDNYNFSLVNKAYSIGQYTQWTNLNTKTGVPNTLNKNSFSVTLPANTITMIRAKSVFATGNVLPLATINSPVTGKTFDLGQKINITVQVNDLDGTISKVEYYDGNIKLGQSSSAPFDFIMPNLGSGIHVIKAKVVDNQNGSSFSNEVKISINPFVTGNEKLEEFENEMFVYFNDDKNVLKIVGILETSSWELYGSNGKLIKQGIGSEANTSELSSGLYILNIGNKRIKFLK